MTYHVVSWKRIMLMPATVGTDTVIQMCIFSVSICRNLHSAFGKKKTESLASKTTIKYPTLCTTFFSKFTGLMLSM